MAPGGDEPLGVYWTRGKRRNKGNEGTTDLRSYSFMSLFELLTMAKNSPYITYL